MDELQTDTVEVNDVTPETSADDVTPKQETQAETQETSETEAPEIVEEAPFIGTYKTKEEAEKGLKEKDIYISKLNQELQELRQSKENTQLQQQKTQVDAELTQIEQARNAQLQPYLERKADLISDYTTELNSYDLTDEQKRYYIKEYTKGLDMDYQAIKRDIDIHFDSLKDQRLQQKQEFSKKELESKILDFKINNPEFCNAYPKTIEKFLAKGFDPEDLTVVQELLEVALSEGESSSSLSAENQQAKQRLNTAISIGKSSQSSDGIPTTWGAIVDKMDSDPKWYMANIKQIQQMKAEGKIK